MAEAPVDGKSFTFPPEWYEDPKMSVMFAPFRDRSRYPKSWDQKMKFWTSLVGNRLAHDGDIIIDLCSLDQKFKRNCKLPLCFKEVIQELIQSSALQQVSEVTSQTRWLSWAYDVVIKKPLSWTYKMVYNSAPVVDGQFVVVSVLKSKSEKVLSMLQEQSLVSSSYIYDYSVLQTCISDLCKSDQEIDIVLRHLVQQKKLLTYKNSSGNQIFKVLKRGESTIPPFQTSEIELYKIDQTIAVLEKEVDTLSASVDRFNEDAREYVRQGRKTTAFHCLKKRKRTENLITKKYNAIENLRHIKEQLLNSASNKMVLEAYTSGTSALSHYLTEHGMTLTNVETVLDDFADVMEETEELNETLSSYKAPQVDEDEDFEEELDRLIEEDTEMDRLAQRFADISAVLPDVPSNDLNSSLTLEDVMSTPHIPDRQPFVPLPGN